MNGTVSKTLLFTIYVFRPLDIANIQAPASLDKTQRVCDVIHHLHGDQQQEQQNNEKILVQKESQGVARSTVNVICVNLTKLALKHLASSKA